MFETDTQMLLDCICAWLDRLYPEGEYFIRIRPSSWTVIVERGFRVHAPIVFEHSFASLPAALAFFAPPAVQLSLF